MTVAHSQCNHDGSSQEQSLCGGAAGWLSLSISACRVCVKVGQSVPAGNFSMQGALAVCRKHAAHHHDLMKLPTHHSSSPLSKLVWRTASLEGYSVARYMPSH